MRVSVRVSVLPSQCTCRRQYVSVCAAQFVGTYSCLVGVCHSCVAGVQAQSRQSTQQNLVVAGLPALELHGLDCVNIILLPDQKRCRFTTRYCCAHK